MTSLIAALPIVLATVLLVGLRWPASRAMSACALVTVGAAAAHWQVPGVQIAAAVVEATTITLGVSLILFGAVFLVEQLRELGAMRTLQNWLSRTSSDLRIQVLLVAWLLGSFLEGAAGFGAPPAITAPLLVALGLSPVLSVALALIGDSIAVNFGAVGTPMMVGMAQGLIGASGDIPTPDVIGRRIAVTDLFIGTLVPALLVMTLTICQEGRRGFALGLRAVPIALVIGAAHLGTVVVVTHVLGPELPSIIGPLVGMLVAVFLLRRGWLVPGEQWPPPAAAVEPQDRDLVADPGATPRFGVGRAALPYVLLVLLLAATRAPGLRLGESLRNVYVGWNDVFGTGIRAQLQPLYSPGAVFVLVTALTPALFRSPVASLWLSARGAWRKLSVAALPLFAAIVTVRVFVHSDGGGSGLAAMPLVLANVVADAAGNVWPLLAPWVGALGSFISGSATFSNLLFAGIQHNVAVAQGHDSVGVLALQGMGAAAGNMICIHNVIAASTVVGLSRAEGEVIRRTAPAMVVYLALATGVGVLGMLGGAR
jgi:lactate permease